MRRAVLLVCLLALAGCFKAGSPLSPTVALDSPFELKVGASAVAPGGLTIRFDAVTSDSRCPMDAMCVQQGEAVLVMTLDRQSMPVAQGEWRTTPDNFEVRYSKYAITLKGLMPYPQASNPTAPGDYVATLVVSER
jgi:hypothetical protein